MSTYYAVMNKKTPFFSQYPNNDLKLIDERTGVVLIQGINSKEMSQFCEAWAVVSGAKAVKGRIENGMGLQWRVTASEL